MKRDVVIVLDCGATNIRAIAVDTQGKIIAKAQRPNASYPSAENAQWQIWRLEHIMQQFGDCCQEIGKRLTDCKIQALTVTTFGVDGALIDAQGGLLYPIISWKCPRTAAVMDDIERYISVKQLQTISGVGQFSANTLYKLIWLKENQPHLLAQAHAWLFISSLINQRLCGAFSTDRTMAGTSQLLDVQQQAFSATILQSTGLSANLFPPMVDAGQHIGNLLPEMAQHLGIAAGTPIIAAGHDTQFALYGSGADLHQPVLSSGTWEILMVRTPQVNTAQLPDFAGSICELDSCRGLFNPGFQWLASGILEWLRQLYWPNQDLTVRQVYAQMVDEARAILPGSDGLRMNCQLLDSHAPAGWSGVRLHNKRGHFYRSALEALAWQLKHNLNALETIAGFKTKELLLVGGGSRNTLWNQIKADILQLPIKILAEAETTVLGAAIFAWSGVGFYASPDQARRQIEYDYQFYYPGAQSADYHSLTN